MRPFTVLLVATPFLAVCIGQEAVILEHPQTQYILVGDITTFHCKTLGQDAFWSINEEAISETHLAIKEKYESQGFTFTDSTHGTWGYHNLTISVSVSENLNNTKIECTVVDGDFFLIDSNTAYLYVFTDLRPYPPRLITIAVRCWDLSPPQVYGSVEVQPRWTGYDITEFRINITNARNGEVLKQATIPYSGQNEYHYFNETLSACVNSLNNSSILVRATVFSRNYGESVPSSAVEATVEKGLGNFSGQAVNHTVFFYPNGTPFLFLEVKLPSTIYSCQKVVYTIEIEDVNTGQFEMQGPYYHMGPKLLVTQNLVSAILHRDNNYTMTVTMESSGEITTSKRYFFNTTLILTPEPCNSNASARDDTFFFQLGISMSLLIAMVIIAILIIFMLSAYIYHKREQIFIALTARRAHNTYPAHDWPLYESVKPASNNTLITDTQQAGLGVTHATSGHTQHSHPFRETDMSDSSMFHENTTHQATSICMATNGKEEYENDIFLVFDSGKKDIFNRKILGKNYS